MKINSELNCDTEKVIYNMKKSEKVDFAIINYWYADDHGAILTAFALQRLIASYGYESLLLRCCKEHERNKSGISMDFEQKYLMSTNEYYGYYKDYFEEPSRTNLNNRFRAFITGSDQVFRAEWTPDSFFLTFVNENKGKIAVAASFGKDSFESDVTPERFDRLAQSISTFDALSIREDDGVEICKQCFEKDAAHILDPVFLVDVKEYYNLINTVDSSIDRNYAFVYIRDKNEANINMVNVIAEKHGLDIIFCDENMPVEKFLYYIKNSFVVLTDSYHGLCYSIIFKKDYLCIINQMRGASRFHSLIKQLNLSYNNFVDECDVSKIHDYTNINYEKNENNMISQIKHGRKWIEDTLKNVLERYE